MNVLKAKHLVIKETKRLLKEKVSCQHSEAQKAKKLQMAFVYQLKLKCTNFMNNSGLI